MDYTTQAQGTGIAQISDHSSDADVSSENLSSFERKLSVAIGAFLLYNGIKRARRKTIKRDG